MRRRRRRRKKRGKRRRRRRRREIKSYINMFNRTTAIRSPLSCGPDRILELRIIRGLQRKDTDDWPLKTILRIMDYLF